MIKQCCAERIDFHRYESSPKLSDQFIIIFWYFDTVRHWTCDLQHTSIYIEIMHYVKWYLILNGGSKYNTIIYTLLILWVLYLGVRWNKYNILPPSARFISTRIHKLPFVDVLMIMIDLLQHNDSVKWVCSWLVYAI